MLNLNEACMRASDIHWVLGLPSPRELGNACHSPSRGDARSGFMRSSRERRRDLKAAMNFKIDLLITVFSALDRATHTSRRDEDRICSASLW